MALPKTTQERIKADAAKYCKDEALGNREDCSYCIQDYIAGAIAEAEFTKRAITLLGIMVSRFEGAAEMADQNYDKGLITKCKNLIQQWNAGKEVDG